MTGRLRAAVALRAVVGLAMVARPADVARVLGAPSAGRHPLLRVLGLRHLMQAGALAGRPDLVTASCAVDSTHVLTCLLLAVVPSRRTPAVRDATLETAVLLATWRAHP